MAPDQNEAQEQEQKPPEQGAQQQAEELYREQFQRFLGHQGES